jgi:pSer/pThr/pTyr-binding forkhead associated (FHA) protein
MVMSPLVKSKYAIQITPVLTVTVDGKNQAFSLLQERCSIGRAIQATIRVPHSQVSRLQALLLRDASGQYQIVDGDGLGTPSRNGTYVNGVKITEKTLQSGDVISLGSSSIVARFFQPETPAPDPLPVDLDFVDDQPTELVVAAPPH